ncbi:MAG TPA: hypothetical protein VGL24_11750, partial [Chthoniobacterales bacterium]
MTSSFASYLRGLALLFAMHVFLSSDLLAGVKRDYGTYPVPPPPPLPAAGGTVIDPTFGTTVMRLTDSQDGPDCINSYSYWPTFNLNSTRLLVYSGTASLLYRFDPAAFKIIDKATWNTIIPGGGSVRWDDAIWSGLDPDLIYCHDNIGMKIWLYNVATQSYTQLADLTAQYRPGDYLWQMSKASRNDNIFAFT